MFRLTLKLKEIKHKLLDWNKERFKNIFKEKLRIEKELENVNIEVIRHGMDQVLYETEKRLLGEYEDILANEEIFWKQKSREVWLSDGDKNTKFFHNSVKLRRAKNRILQITNEENQIIIDQKMIVEDAIQYFRNMLNNWEYSDLSHNRDLIKNIPKLLSEEDNKMLNAKITKEEVKQALSQFSGDKAPRLDGYPAGFYQKCWHIIGDEVSDALEAARNAGNFPKEINSTFLALLPKKENHSRRIQTHIFMQHDI
ncbi:uncharacterized protein LOC131029792 [Cryptomeria japonica]|uniref:uncharacterized protein LOC131029792 n=1 Tax=Cryptomeria japonica TaxID=3369 RepID=UPI0025AC7B1B|nr:uncharacterized protein LOC131029792 [Cryptomeria japonica]